MDSTRGLYIGLSFLLVLALSSGACGRHPEISVEQIDDDLVGRSVGDGFPAWLFGKEEPREIAIIESSYQGNAATIIIEIKTESKPIRFSTPAPTPATPTPTPTPTPSPTPTPTPTQTEAGAPRWIPPPMPKIAPFRMPPPPSFAIKPFVLPEIPARKMAGRLRLKYEWVADQWNLIKIENLSFKRIE